MFDQAPATGLNPLFEMPATYIPGGYEDQYLGIVRAILDHGITEKNERTGVVTKRLPGSQIVVDVGQELPILTCKSVAWKTAIDELIWIYIKNGSNIDDLRNPKIWEKNCYPDRTVGKTYGFQAGKSPDKAKFENQLDYVIETLKNDKSSRQAVLDLWDTEDLPEMALPPCIITSAWTVIRDTLNCNLFQRSSDFMLGVPFDTFQAAVLMHLISRELDVRPGMLIHRFGDTHIYENHFETAERLLKQAETERYPAPWLKIADKPLNELTVDDFKLIGYTHGPKFEFTLN